MKAKGSSHLDCVVSRALLEGGGQMKVKAVLEGRKRPGGSKGQGRGKDPLGGLHLGFLIHP